MTTFYLINPKPRKLLTTKLDNHINGENSVENQQKALDKIKFDQKKEKTRAKYEQKRLEKLGSNAECDRVVDEPTDDNAEPEPVSK